MVLVVPVRGRRRPESKGVRVGVCSHGSSDAGWCGSVPVVSLTVRLLDPLPSGPIRSLTALRLPLLSGSDRSVVDPRGCDTKRVVATENSLVRLAREETRLCLSEPRGRTFLVGRYRSTGSWTTSLSVSDLSGSLFGRDLETEFPGLVPVRSSSGGLFGRYRGPHSPGY